MRVLRWDLDLVRQAIHPRGGDTLVVAINIHSAKGDRLLAAKGQHVEVVAAKKDGRISVVDDRGNHFWVRDMLLDSYEEPDALDVTDSDQGDTSETESLKSAPGPESSAIYESLRNLDALIKKESSPKRSSRVEGRAAKPTLMLSARRHRTPSPMNMRTGPNRPRSHLGPPNSRNSARFHHSHMSHHSARHPMSQCRPRRRANHSQCAHLVGHLPDPRLRSPSQPTPE